jgi:hypothetical protein
MRVCPPESNMLAVRDLDNRLVVILGIIALVAPSIEVLPHWEAYPSRGSRRIPIISSWVTDVDRSDEFMLKKVCATTKSGPSPGVMCGL